MLLATLIAVGFGIAGIGIMILVFIKEKEDGPLCNVLSHRNYSKYF